MQMSVDLSDWTLVFDLDGTLVETAPDLHAALNHIMAHKGLTPIPIVQIRNMIGDGAKALIRKGLHFQQRSADEHEIDVELWPLFLEHYEANITRYSRPFEDCVTALQALSESGATLAVCTNKAQHLADKLLHGLGLSHFFDSVIGGDALAVKKPDGDHILETIAGCSGDTERAIMIGDSQIDEKAARNAGLPFVFVSFGYGALSHQPYDRIRSINHWRDMQQALCDLANPH
jgi:phosphoglycolate phosphatase